MMTTINHKQSVAIRQAVSAMLAACASLNLCSIGTGLDVVDAPVFVMRAARDALTRAIDDYRAASNGR